MCAKLGLAYDLRTVTPDMVEYKANRFGDGSHPVYQQAKNNENKSFAFNAKLPSWGLEDEDTLPEDLKMLKVLHKSKSG